MEVSSIKVPPNEILNIKNFEHIILWMLNNNERCQWSDFVSDPVGISGSTLSGYLKNLKNLGYLEKTYHRIDGRERNVYIITPEGERRYHELSTYQTEEVKLNFPPSILLNRRNYDHWILWMVYNNTSCKWSDFLADPLNINQSSLSKNLNQLIKEGLVSKDQDEKTYTITQAGKKSYSQMLRKYDLDRQSILEEESKRIEELVGKIKKFFGNKQISDDIKFRFISNVLKLDYTKINEPQENFFKIVLFISLNHPSDYPNYTQLSRFARDYNIEERILNYYIPEIIENELYPTKFFTLTIEGTKSYYFREDDEFERNLRTLVDDCITKLTYLNKLYVGTSNELKESQFYDKIIKNIINRAIGTLIPEELKHAMEEFLPNYVSHLLYKFDTETEINKSIDKTDALAYDRMYQIFQALKPVKHFKDDEEESENFYVDPHIFKFLKPVKSDKIHQNLLFEGIPKIGLLDIIDRYINYSPNDLDLKLLKAIIFCILRRYNEAIRFLEKEIKLDDIEHNTEDFITTKFILTYANIGIGNYTQAREIRSNLDYHGEMLIGLLDAFIYAYNIIYEFDPDISTEEEFHDTMNFLITKELDEETKSKLYYYYSFILHLTGNTKEALEKVQDALKIKTKKDTRINLLSTKAYYLMDLDLNEAAVKILWQISKEYPKKEAITQFKIASLYFKLGKPDRIKESKEILEHINPKDLGSNELDYYNTMVYVLAKLNDKDEAMKLAEYLIEIDPSNGNYYDSYGEILMIFGEYKKAVEKFKRAIELEPDGWFLYETFIKLGRCQMKLGHNEDAIENIKKGKSFIRRNLPCCKKHFTWIEKADKYLKQLDVL